MKEGIQELEWVYPEIRRSGCLFLCLIQLRHRFETVSSKEINALYRQCVKAGFMQEDCFVNDCEKILQLLEYPRKIERLDVINYNTADPRKIEVPRESILYLRKPGFSHFILKYPNSSMWDPLPPERPASYQYRVTEVREIY